MPFLLVIIGALLIVAAFNNSQMALASALEQDVPPFLKWAAAIAAIGAIGWIPGMQVLSRWLLALVLVVIVLSNYQQALAGFQSVAQSTQAGGGGGQPTPAQTYAANPNAAPTAGPNQNANAQQPAVQSPFGAFDPGNYLSVAEQGFGQALAGGL